MRLYLLRHGRAEDPGPGMSDSDRRLTPEGVREMEAVAAALARMDLRPDLILTSPMPRARETAEIVARTLGLEHALRVEPRVLSLGLGELQQIAAENPRTARLLVVGHEPTLSLVAGRLCGGSAIRLRKAGLIRLDVERFEPEGAELVWLVPPAVLLRGSHE